MSLEEFSTGRGIAYHGTDAASARMISGLRVGRSSEPTNVRTGFNSKGLGINGREDTYPRLYGPGLYVTSSLNHAKGYAEDASEKAGAIVSGELTAKSPLSMRFEEIRNLAEHPRVQQISTQLAARKPHLNTPTAVPTEVEGQTFKDRLHSFFNSIGVQNPGIHHYHDRLNDETLEALDKHGITDPNFRRHVYEHFMWGDSPEWQAHKASAEPGVKSNGTPLTGADMAGVNMYLRTQGHDYLHVPETAFKVANSNNDGLLYKDSAVILRPNAFKPRTVDFMQGMTEHVK